MSDGIKHGSVRLLRNAAIVLVGFFVGCAIIGPVGHYQTPEGSRAEAQRRASDRPRQTWVTSADAVAAAQHEAPMAAPRPLTDMPSPATTIADGPPGATTAAEAEPVGPLTQYLGTYPFEVVGEEAFITDPIVVAAIETAVPDRTVADRVRSSGVASPIQRRRGYLHAWGCEPHNCGRHHWVIFINEAGGKAAVCYHNEEASGQPRWYGDQETISIMAAGTRSLTGRRCP